VRYQLLAEIAHGVRRGRQLVFVFGPDRIGKTTFLRQLGEELRAEIEPVYVDLAWPEPG
jgi:predicted AAA+ superfamily ATPase